MILDVRTMYMALAATCFIVAAALLTLQTRRFQRDGALQWALGWALQGAFWVLLGLRGIIGDFLSIVVAHTSLAASYSLLYAAVRRFQGRTYNTGMLLFPVAATFIFFWYFSAYADNLLYRIIFISLLSILQISAIVQALLRNAPAKERLSYWLTGFAFFMMAGVWLNRLLEALTLPYGHLSILQATTFRNASVVTLLGAAVLSSIGFVLMIRGRAEEALRESEEHYHSLFDNMINGFAHCKMLFDQNGPKDFIYLNVNSAFEVLTGLKNVTGKKVSEIIPGIRESDPELFEIYGRVALTGTPERFEKYVEALGMWFSISVYSPRKEYFVAVFDVITERKRAESRVQREMEYKDFLLLLHEMAPQLSDKELYDYVLEETVRLTDSAIGFFHRVSDDQKTVVLTTWNSEALKNCTASYETHYLLEQAGNWVDCVRFGRSVIYNDFPNAPNRRGLPDGHVPVRRFMSIPVMEGDKVRVIFGVGNKAEEYDESDALQIQLVANTLHAIMKVRRAETALHKANDELELRVQERTDELRQAHEKLEAEMTERTRMEEQLRQAQKMEAIGTLAGGIAHDFNNILAAMIGFSELAADDIPADSKAQHRLKRVREAGLRARELVKQILAFSRKSEGERKQISLTPLIQETHALLRASLPATIQMSLAITTSDDYVRADSTQIQQVLMNLATNAAHAMRDGGQLTIGVSSVSFPRGSLLPDPDMGPGAYVKLTVKDTGTGMTEEVRQRIFEPFFTTKETGKGTGMGLAVVYGVVKSHGGAVTVQSEVGRGSIFDVFLPQVQKPDVSKEATTTSTLPTGTERILFVDDEETLVEMGRSMLESLGYQVTVAKHPTDAWELFLEDPSRFDIVITDQTMPDVTGVALALKILRVRKEMPIILCTGYSEMVSADKAKGAGLCEFVMKPMLKKELAETIRRALDRTKG